MTYLTYPPLPGFINLFRAILAPRISGDQLAIPWKQGDESVFWFSRSSWSLYAIARLRMKIFNKSPLRIWLPDFFCNDALTPLRELEIEFDFYQIDSPTQANYDSCRSMLASGLPDIIIFAHYFGQPFSVNALKEIAEETQAWLIEDCTHCLRPDSGIGNSGDFVLYSPHKLLAVPDGALVLLRRNGPSSLLTDGCLKENDFYSICNLVLHQWSRRGTNVLKWCLKRLLQELGIRGKGGGCQFNEQTVQTSANGFYGAGMSTLAAKLLPRLVIALSQEATIRKQNAIAWQETLHDEGFIPKAIPVTNCQYTPYLATFGFDESGDAEKYFNFFQKAGIPVSTWPDLPPDIIANKNEHAVAHNMRYTRIYFPVHGSIEPGKIRSSLRCIR